MVNQKGPVFVAVRRLRFGMLIQNVAGERSNEVTRRDLIRLADFANVSGLEEEAREILSDLQAFESEGEDVEPWL